MWYKHAVWCQCAVVFHLILAGAALLSCQGMTLFVDMYWSVVLIIGALIQFVAAEHSDFWEIPADRWIRLETLRALWIQCVLGLWHLFRGSPLTITTGTLVIGGLVMVHRIPPFACFCCVACIHCYMALGQISWIWCIWGFTLFRRYKCERMIVGKSLSNPVMRELQLYKSVSILAEAICIWQVRCAHRFPHTFRWTPFFVSMCGFGVGMAYCTRYVANTLVSRNAIISNVGHGIACSYTAAQKCKVCLQCLTSLDMESSFSE